MAWSGMVSARSGLQRQGKAGVFMSHEINEGKYAWIYRDKNIGASRAFARSVIDGDDNLLRADRPSFRRRVRKFLKLAAMKLGLL